MTQTIHIMLNLKKWGKVPGCDIRSIGACVFDPLTGYVAGYHCPTGSRECPTFYIVTDNPELYDYTDVKEPYDRKRKYPLTRDPSTVQWWNDQSPEAQATFGNPVDLREALERFGAWLHQMQGSLYDRAGIMQPTDTIRLWSDGPAFDPPILAAAYAAVGLPVPWHYRAPRDTRTLFDAAGIDDHSAFMTAYNTGTAHHALDDAIAQAKSVCGAYERLRLPHDVLTHRDAWREGLVTARDFACEGSEQPDADRSYYQHELRAFDRTFDALASYPRFDEGVRAPNKPFNMPTRHDNAAYTDGLRDLATMDHISDEIKGVLKDCAILIDSLTRNKKPDAVNPDKALMPDHEPALREMRDHLAWIQKAGGKLPAKYLGLNIAQIATMIIREARPDLAPLIDG